MYYISKYIDMWVFNKPMAFVPLQSYYCCKNNFTKIYLFNGLSIFYSILNKHSITDFNGLEIVLVKTWSISHLVETSIGEIGKGIFMVEMGIR